jgi:rhodanese-related sulfurtransferase
MSKNRKHRETSVGAPGAVVETNLPLPSPGADISSHGLISRRVLVQLLAMLGLSGVLGFTFNAASPVGIRFDEPVVAPVAAPAPEGVAPLSKTSVSQPPIPVPSLPVAPAPVAVPPAQPVAAALPVPKPHSHPAANPVIIPAISPAGQTNPAPIHWVEAKALAADGRAVLVDVRHKSMYDAGHIPGAISLPEMSPPPDFTAFLSQQPTNLTVIVYCSSTSCSQSLRVANRLVTEFRWASVRYMTGGYMEYQQAELAKPTPTPTP